MNRRVTKISVCLLLICLFELSGTAAPREREVNDPGDIQDRLVRLIKRIKAPIVRLFDDGIVVPKP